MSSVLTEIITEKKVPKNKNRRRRPKKKSAAKVNMIRRINRVNKNTERSVSLNKELVELKKLRMSAFDKIKQDLEPKYAKYALAVMDPDNHLSKLPDSYNSPTALYKSVQVIPIRIDFTNNPNGDFAIYVKPNIGTIVPSNSSYQIAVSKPNPTNLLEMTSANYNFYSDPQATMFYSGLNGQWAVEHAFSGNTYGVIPAVWTSNVVFHTGSSDSTPTSALATTTCPIITEDIPESATAGSGFSYDTKTMRIPSGGTGYIRCYRNLSGWYMISNYCYYPGGSLVVGQKNYFMFASDITATSFKPLYLIASASTAYQDPSLTNDNFFIVNNDLRPVNSQAVTQGILWRCNFYYKFESSKNYYFSGAFATSNTTPDADSCLMNTTFTKVNPPGSLEDDSLLIPKLRPVAMSALLTNVTPNLYKGGVIGCLSAITGESKYFDQPDSSQNLQTIAGMTTLNADESGRCKSSMPAAKGAYAFWLPYQNVSQTDLVSVNQLNSQDYGGIAFSGNVTGTAGSTTASTVFFLRVVTLFEYTTTTRLIETRAFSGETNKMQAVLSKIYSNKSIIFENPMHLGQIKDMFLSAMSPIYGLSKLTGTDPGKNLKKFSDVATSLISNAPNAESLMDLLPVLLSAL